MSKYDDLVRKMKKTFPIDAQCGKLAINLADSEFEVADIKGTHNIPAVFTSLESEGNSTKTLKSRWPARQNQPLKKEVKQTQFSPA